MQNNSNNSKVFGMIRKGTKKTVQVKYLEQHSRKNYLKLFLPGKFMVCKEQSQSKQKMEKKMKQEKTNLTP